MMDFKRVLIKSSMLSLFHRIFNVKNCFQCPICDYYGKFESFGPETGVRKNARCPGCGSLERHRLQYLVLGETIPGLNTRAMSMLHFAPEFFFRRIFREKFGIYVTADLLAEDVDRKEDLTHMSFGDNSFDFLYASHVLEHVQDDCKALAEIKRVLKPKGIAILPVPIIGEKTIEYSKPNPHEFDHVRSTGKDYYEKYKAHFKTVKLYSSSDFNPLHQLHVYEDRSKKIASMPLRPAVSGDKHEDIVPVCFK